MKRRTLNDWRGLIEQQQASGLSIVGFCKQQKLTTSNFYKYRTRLQENGSTPKLVKINSTSLTPVNKSITLTPGNTQLTLPSNCKSHWLAGFIKALNT
jgi:putative transposase